MVIIDKSNESLLDTSQFAVVCFATKILVKGAMVKI